MTDKVLADKGEQRTYEDAMAGIAPALRAIANALRKAIVAIDRDATEVAWPRMKIASYGVGPKKMSEHYAYIAPQKSHVNLGFYHGVALKDPAGLLEGKGKRLRHVKIRSIDQAQSSELAALLKASVREREQTLKRR